MSNESPPPRNLLFVHSSDDLYGADRILFELVTRLDKDRFRTLVVLPDDVGRQGGLSRHLREHGIPTRTLRLAVLRRRYLSPWGVVLYLARLCRSTIALSRLIRRESIDLVHSHTSAVIPGALAAWLTRTPHVWQTLEIIIRPRFLWRCLAWLLPRLSRKVVAGSGPTLDHLCAGNQRNEAISVVLRNGIDAARIESGRGHGPRVRKELGVGADQPLVAVVGRISRWKGQNHFLQMAAELSKTHPDARFLMVGSPFPGEEQLVDEIRSLARELGIEQRIVLAGFRDDIPAVLDALDILVLPSILPDPFPTVVLEAMAAGKPVVAYAHGGCVEMIEDRATGVLVEAGCLDAMVSAVRSLLEEPEARLRMGAAGSRRARSRFSLDDYVQDWTRLYDEVLRDGGPGAAAAEALKRAIAAEEEAERESNRALQFAVGNGGRQGQAAKRAASRKLQRATARRRKAEKLVQSCEGSRHPEEVSEAGTSRSRGELR